MAPAANRRRGNVPTYSAATGGALGLVDRQEAARLAVPELGVEAVPGEKLGMGAGLDDAPLVHHHQPVEHGDGRQAVGDGDDRAPLHEAVELLLDRRLDLRIERAGRLVEHQDRRVLEDQPGDGDALALAAGELDAALADPGVVAGAALQVAEARR